MSKPTRAVLNDHRPVRMIFIFPLCFSECWCEKHSHHLQVHIRLTEKGKEYQENIAKKRVDIKKHDFDGKQLFVPKFMNKDRLPGTAWSNGVGKGTGNGPPNPTEFLQPSTPQQQPYFNPNSSSQENFNHNTPLNQSLQSNTSHNNSAQFLNNVSADEFLYQDAKDREERFRMRAIDAKEEAVQTANCVKINSTSYAVLKKKAVSIFISILKFY